MKNIKLFLLLFLLLASAPQETNAQEASLYFTPASGTFLVGSTFDVSIFVNTGGRNINAVQVDVEFNPNILQVASPTAGKSFIDVWVAHPTYCNIEGKMRFIGGLPSPGINTSAGLVSTVTFRVLAPGQTTLLFSDSSKILEDNPEGKNILTSMSRGVYDLVIPPPEGPKVFSPTHPDTNKWYRDNNPTLCWEKAEGVTGFSYVIDQDPRGFPDNVSQGEHTCVSYSEIEDGVWYFHVKSEKNGIWGGTSHYSLRIDNTSPAAFTPTIEPSLETTESQPLVSFITTDALSGISHYEIKYIDITPGKKELETGFLREVSSPYKLPPLEMGKYLIVVRAYDMAGNWREGTVEIKILPEKVVFTKKGIQFKNFVFPWWVLIYTLIIAMAFVFFYLWKEYKLTSRK